MPASFTEDLRFVWLSRADVRGSGLECDEEAERYFFAWWVCRGRHEHPAAVPLGQDRLAVAFAPVSLSLQAITARLPAVLAFIWKSRPDLRRLFPGAEAREVENLTRWFFLHGAAEYSLFDVLPAEFTAMANAPMPGFPETMRLPITRLMHWAWEERGDLQKTFDLGSPEGRQNFLAWFYVQGLHEMGLAEFVAEDTRDLLGREGGLENGAPGLRLADRLVAIWHGARPQEAQGCRDWVDNAAEAAGVRALLAPQTVPFAPGASLSRFEDPRRHDGVNLIGLARPESGIGEDLRMAGAALAAAGIPFSVLAVPTDGKAKSVAGQISDLAPFAINLLCLSGLDAIWLRTLVGASLWKNRLTIGWWPWELPLWPADLRDAFRLIDEIWASSTYTASAYRLDCPGPVALMPLPVAIDPVPRVSHAALGLPEEAFLFVFVFDASSSIHRKNPEAALEAFRLAFPAGREPVGLVIKTMNTPADENWRAFAASCARDPRVFLIDRTWGRPEVLGLIATCDAMISLHRAEGFGRTLAEAMLLQKPVIATDFSGNCDFLTVETGYPVRYAYRTVGTGEFPHAAGQVWADPNVNHAAELMRAIVGDPDRARAVARNGRAFIAEHHNPAAIGARMLGRLRALGLERRGLTQPARDSTGAP